jgi:hypothetical protein
MSQDQTTKSPTPCSEEASPCSVCGGDRVLPVMDAKTVDETELPCPFCTGGDDDER